MDRKYFVIGGLAILAVAFFVGVFSPSGFVFMGTEPTAEYACMDLYDHNVRCGGNSYWQESDSSWSSHGKCEDARDYDGKPCKVRKCDCQGI
ncbi:MAG: hypothetical protein QF475_03655 [Candidatus Undinarchaeales archaeon]|jgi:hypothetical protein|nr:hypothetical protein [Candidatus Undinarchaeales archaeon]